MELNQLQLFVLLAEYRNFSKVAETYHISQSAVSKQISLLEYELGGKLFERDTRSVRISERGYALLPYAKQIIKLEQEARLHFNAVNLEMEKKIFAIHIDESLFSDSSVSLGYAPRILRAIYHLNRSFPNFKIKTHVFPPNEWRSQMKFQQFDVALMRIPQDKLNEPVSNFMTRTKIYTIPQYLVVHSPTRVKTLDEALESVEMLLQDQSITIKDAIGRFILKVKPTMRIVDCENWNNLYFDLLTSTAATVVPESAVALFSGLDDVSIIPLENMNVEECLCAICRESVPEAVLSLFTEELSRLFLQP